MAGILPDEGENFISRLLFKNDTADRGTNLTIGLFTNPSPSETTTALDITLPNHAGSTYASQTLLDSGWTVTGDLAEYTGGVTFTAGEDYTGVDVWGYFIQTNGTNPRLIAIEKEATAINLVQNDQYIITPRITIA